MDQAEGSAGAAGCGLRGLILSVVSPGALVTADVSMDPHEEYFRSLPLKERHLLALREILYDGSWDEMVQDLLARKEGKPFVYKLNTCIDEDLQRIEKLRAYEAQHGVNLGTYVAIGVPGEGEAQE